MRKLLIIGLFALLPAFAQEGGKSEAKEAPDETLVLLKWANFIILAGGLGYLAKKHLAPIFRDKSEEIRKGIADAQALKADADKKIAEIERRVNSLGTEIEKFRTEHAAEMKIEGERIRQETAAAIAKAEQQAAFEVESAGKLARKELKEYAANLAVDQAEQRLRAQLNGSSTEGTLIDNFISDLAQRGSKN